MSSQFKALLEAAVKETGADLGKSKDEVAMYMSERTAHLAQIVGFEGFDMAVVAERDNVALFAGLHAVAQSDSIRDRILGIIQGALFIGASALTGGVAGGVGAVADLVGNSDPTPGDEGTDSPETTDPNPGGLS